MPKLVQTGTRVWVSQLRDTPGLPPAFAGTVVGCQPAGSNPTYTVRPHGQTREVVVSFGEVAPHPEIGDRVEVVAPPFGLSGSYSGTPQVGDITTVCGEDTDGFVRLYGSGYTFAPDALSAVPDSLPSVGDLVEITGRPAFNGIDPGLFTVGSKHRVAEVTPGRPPEIRLGTPSACRWFSADSVKPAESAEPARFAPGDKVRIVAPPAGMRSGANAAPRPGTIGVVTRDDSSPAFPYFVSARGADGIKCNLWYAAGALAPVREQATPPTPPTPPTPEFEIGAKVSIEEYAIGLTALDHRTPGLCASGIVTHFDRGFNRYLVRAEGRDGLVHSLWYLPSSLRFAGVFVVGDIVRHHGVRAVVTCVNQHRVLFKPERAVLVSGTTGPSRSRDGEYWTDDDQLTREPAPVPFFGSITPSRPLVGTWLRDTRTENTGLCVFVAHNHLAALIVPEVGLRMVEIADTEEAPRPAIALPATGSYAYSIPLGGYVRVVRAGVRRYDVKAFHLASELNVSPETLIPVPAPQPTRPAGFIRGTVVSVGRTVGFEHPPRDGAKLAAAGSLYLVDGGSPTSGSRLFAVGTTLAPAFPTPTKDGYHGWLLNAELKLFADPLPAGTVFKPAHDVGIVPPGSFRRAESGRWGPAPDGGRLASVGHHYAVPSYLGPGWVDEARKVPVPPGYTFFGKGDPTRVKESGILYFNGAREWVESANSGSGSHMGADDVYAIPTPAQAPDRPEDPPAGYRLATSSDVGKPIPAGVLIRDFVTERWRPTTSVGNPLRPLSVEVKRFAYPTAPADPFVLPAGYRLVSDSDVGRSIPAGALFRDSVDGWRLSRSINDVLLSSSVPSKRFAYRTDDQPATPAPTAIPAGMVRAGVYDAGRAIPAGAKFWNGAVWVVSDAVGINLPPSAVGHFAYPPEATNRPPVPTGYRITTGSDAGAAIPDGSLVLQGLYGTPEWNPTSCVGQPLCAVSVGSFAFPTAPTAPAAPQLTAKSPEVGSVVRVRVGASTSRVRVNRAFDDGSFLASSLGQELPYSAGDIVE